MQTVTTPKDNSSGGGRRQGRISRQGNEALRKLVVLGATAVIRFAKPGHALRFHDCTAIGQKAPEDRFTASVR
jgi:transposase